MMICPDASSAQNSMAAVLADGSTVCVLMRRLNSSCNRSMALVVLTLFHLAWRQRGESEKAIAGLLQAVGNGAVAQPPLAQEGFTALLNLLRRIRVDHICVVGRDLVMQPLGRVGE